PVAQWIEQRFPKPRALVRFRAGASGPRCEPQPRTRLVVTEELPLHSSFEAMRTKIPEVRRIKAPPQALDRQATEVAGRSPPPLDQAARQSAHRPASVASRTSPDDRPGRPTTRPHMLRFRGDVEGLRAVAVLLVVLNH